MPIRKLDLVNRARALLHRPEKLAAPRPGKWQTFEDVGGQFRYRFKAGNGEIMMVSSESHTRRFDATRAMRKAIVLIKASP